MSKLATTFENVLENKKAFGESRHQAKKDGSDKDKIFSFNTMKEYKRVANYFADFVNERDPKARHLNQAKKYVNDFMEQVKAEGKSAWTQQSYNSALSKLFGENLCSIELDKKERATITRSRFDVPNARHFSEEKNEELVNFCKHTGLRRSELENLKPEQLKQDENENYFLEIKGKGGKIRNAYILNNDSRVIEKIKNTKPNELVWGRVHSACNVHGYRADYAKSFYESVKRDLKEIDNSEKYFCRKDMNGIVFDKEAMKETSESLGHNRIDVIAENYLY